MNQRKLYTKLYRDKKEQTNFRLLENEKISSSSSLQQVNC